MVNPNLFAVIWRGGNPVSIVTNISVQMFKRSLIIAPVSCIIVTAFCVTDTSNKEPYLFALVMRGWYFLDIM